MKKNLTEIVFIIDESGSMYDLKKDTIGGFNSVLEEQRGKEGEVLVSTVLFNQHSRVLYDRVPLSKIENMGDTSYNPNGMTALLDAIGGAIHHIGNVHKYARNEDVPENTLFIITTDGLENSSTKYSAEKVKKMISKQQKKHGWEFIGTSVMYAAMCGAVSEVRAHRPLGNSNMGWRKKADEDYNNR